MRVILAKLFDQGNAKHVVPDIYEGSIVNSPSVLDKKSQHWKLYKSHACEERVEHQGQSLKNDHVVYILRNPLDVFCSQLNYILRVVDRSASRIQVDFSSVDDVVSAGAMEDFLSAFTIYGTLTPGFVDAGSWMENAQYWLERARNDKKVTVVHYEGLLSNFFSEMQEILDLFGFSESEAAKALDFSNNATEDGGNFYWKKKSGTYEEYLNKDQISKFASYHEDILKATGYADELCKG